jgi:two-component system response regulator DctR
MNGLTLLQRLRSAGSPIEVIAMTARADSRTVRAIVQRGALDYLVKPFSVERLRQALARFLVRANALRAEVLDQEAVDRACAAGRRPQRWLPKGLTSEGLESVSGSLASHPGPASANDVAVATGLARVTARRYLEYLVATEQASVEAPPVGPGRPRKLYRPAVV